jgi:AcrR family transcriptional regulator
MASITRSRAPRSKRREESETALMAATERLLDAGESITQLGVQRIADEAGVARSTFYLCFRDKADLLLRLAGSMKDDLFELSRHWTPTGEDGGPDGLAAVFEAQYRFYRERAALHAAIAEAAVYDPIVGAAMGKQVDRFVRRITSLLREEQRAGRLTDEVDAPIAGKALAWGGEQITARQVGTGDPKNDAAVAREVALTQWYGTYRRPAG